MIKLRYCSTAITIGALFVASAAFSTTTSVEYATAQAQVKSELKADLKLCGNLKENAKDVCKAQAKGRADVARALAEYNYTGKPSDANALAVAQAAATFAVATEFCDDKAGDAKSLCRTEAKAAYDKAVADAKMSDKVSAAVKTATQDKREADYSVAKAKCDSLAGDPQTACMNDAKARYNMH